MDKDNPCGLTSWRAPRFTAYPNVASRHTSLLLSAYIYLRSWCVPRRIFCLLRTSRNSTAKTVWRGKQQCTLRILAARIPLGAFSHLLIPLPLRAPGGVQGPPSLSTKSPGVHRRCTWRAGGGGGGGVLARLPYSAQVTVISRSREAVACPKRLATFWSRSWTVCPLGNTFSSSYLNSQYPISLPVSRRLSLT